MENSDDEPTDVPTDDSDDEWADVKTYECEECGNRLTAEHQPGRCPECGGPVVDISIPRE